MILVYHSLNKERIEQWNNPFTQEGIGLKINVTILWRSHDIEKFGSHFGLVEITINMKLVTLDLGVEDGKVELKWKHHTTKVNISHTNET